MRLLGIALTACLLLRVADAGAGAPLPAGCRLELADTDLPEEQKAGVASAWQSAVETAMDTRDRLLAAEESAGGSEARRRKKRETRLALMQSRIVANQQQIFLALGSEGHELADRLSGRLEDCIAGIRSSLD